MSETIDTRIEPLIEKLTERLKQTPILPPIGGKEHLGKTLFMIAYETDRPLPAPYADKQSFTNDELVERQLHLHIDHLQQLLQSRWGDKRDEKIDALLDMALISLCMANYIEETTE